MLNYAKCKRIAVKAAVPEDIIEKDYFIELLLFYISRNKFLKAKFVFRGGTALKKVYFPDYRFNIQ